MKDAFWLQPARCAACLTFAFLLLPATLTYAEESQADAEHISTTAKSPLTAEQALQLRSIRQLVTDMAASDDREEVLYLAQRAEDQLIPLLVFETPDRLEPWRYFALIALAREDPGFASVALNAIRQLKPDFHEDDAYLDLAAQLQNLVQTDPDCAKLFKSDRQLLFQLAVAMGYFHTNQFVDPIEKIIAYRSIVEALAEIGVTDESRIFLLKASAASERIPNEPITQVFTYCNISSAYSEMGLTREAQEYFSKAEASIDGIPASDLPVAVYEWIIEAQVQMGDIDEATRTLEKINGLEDNFDAYLTVMRAHAKAGKISEVTDILNANMEAWRSENGDNTLVTIAMAVAFTDVSIYASKQGAHEVAKKFITLAQDAVKSLTGPEMEVSLYCRVAIAQSKAGFLDDSNRSLNHATAIAMTINDPTEKSSAFQKIAGAQSQTGNIQQALAYAKNISNSSILRRTYFHIAIALYNLNLD